MPMEETLQRALEEMIYGIYLLTTCRRDEINGMIASWVSQVSYEPPMLMVAVHPNRYSHQMIVEGGCFALHVLERDQADLLARFKGPEHASKFSSIPWERGRNGCPILKTCVACMECEVKTEYRPGNHTLFIGEIKVAHVFTAHEPLCTLDYAGVYLGKE